MSAERRGGEAGLLEYYGSAGLGMKRLGTTSLTQLSHMYLTDPQTPEPSTSSPASILELKLPHASLSCIRPISPPPPCKSTLKVPRKVTAYLGISRLISGQHGSKTSVTAYLREETSCTYYPVQASSPLPSFLCMASLDTADGNGSSSSKVSSR